MKKIAKLLILIIFVSIIFACASSKKTCPAYSTFQQEVVKENV